MSTIPKTKSITAILDTMTSELIYLDHAAATPLDRRVLAVMQPYFSERFFNPSSPNAPALSVKRDYDEAKHALQRSLVQSLTSSL